MGNMALDPERAASKLPSVVEAALLDIPAAEPGYLFEGPSLYASGRVVHRADDYRIMWVDIQISHDSLTGRLCFWNAETREYKTVELPGRVGFAFRTTEPDVILMGLEKEIVLFSIEKQAVVRSLSEPVEVGEKTIVNDALLVPGGLLFGTKHLTFSEAVAGLYYLPHLPSEAGRSEPVRLLAGLTISNGMDLYHDDSSERLIHVDTLTKKVCSYRFDEQAVSLTDKRTLLDLTDVPGFPDGLCLDPSKQHLLVALFNTDAAVTNGELRQFALSTGALEKIYLLGGAPQVTCPMLLPGRVIITTAREGMSDERLGRCPNSGRMFIAPTEFNEFVEPLYWPL